MKAKQDLNTFPGVPYPLGASVLWNGRINFAVDLYSAAKRRPESDLYSAAECGVLIYRRDHRGPIRISFEKGEKVGSVWCMQVEGLREADFEYNFYAGEKELADPCARLIHGNERWGKQISPRVRCGLIREEYDWEGDQPLMTPLSESILYLIHTRGFTRHAGSGVEAKGCFAGVAEKLPYLKELGVTAVELMPSYEFLELERPKEPAAGAASMEEARMRLMEKPVQDQELRINYWGYKEGFYFAPKRSYSASERPDREFKDMVKALHRAGIEVIMQFYFPAEVKQTHILEVLRHWVVQYHVDGFHLMGVGIPMALLGTEPILAHTKLFCQDVPCGQIYPGGETPAFRNLALYHDGFLYAMRHFLKSDEDALGNALACLKRNPRQTGIINYMTNYCGFTLADLVSYDRKHNEENGEENRDGESYNVSWNCGCEGKTRKRGILELRRQQMRNAMTLLLTAQGTPMIVSGDEFGFSRGGNNNPYCQDNPVSWLNWGLLKNNQDFFRFVKELIALRKNHPILHMEEEMRMADFLSLGYPDLSYHGEEAWRLDIDRLSRTAGVMYCGRYAGREEKADSFFYIAYNMHWEKHAFALPGLPEGLEWRVVCDTAQSGPDCAEDSASAASEKAISGNPERAVSDTSERAASDHAGESEGRRKIEAAGRSIRILQSVPVKSPAVSPAGKKTELVRRAEPDGRTDRADSAGREDSAGKLQNGPSLFTKGEESSKKAGKGQ